MSEEIIGFYDSTNNYNIVEKNAVYLVEQLKERGNQVMTFSCESSPLSKSMNERSVPVSKIDESRKYVNLVLSYRLSRALKKEHCKVLVILRPHDLITAIMTKTLFCRKLRLVFFQQIKFKLRKNFLLYSLLFKPFDAWIVSMEHYQHQITSISNFPPEKIFHIPPGIDIDHYEKDTLSRSSARKILKLPHNINLIGVLGRHHIAHRQDFLIRAIQLLRKHRFNIDLLLMGTSKADDEKEYFNFLKELAVECGVENYVHFRTYTEKEITFFKSIDIYAQITMDGLNDNHLLKALSLEVPVITFSSEDMDEILEKGKYGMLYKNNDLQNFTAKITHLLTQPKIRDHLNAEAKRIIHDKYNLQLRCEKFESVLNHISET